MTSRPNPVGILTLVHPDFLPAVYSLSEVIVDAGCDVDVFSFTSLAPGRTTVKSGIRMHDCGPASGTARDRKAARRAFRRRVEEWFSRQAPRALIACCPFSYLEALRLARGKVPVIYWAFELYDASLSDLMRSPLTTLRNRAALRRMREAALVVVPSTERAGWLLQAAGLDRLPEVVFNCPRYERAPRADSSSWPAWLPEGFRGAAIVLNSGNIGPTHCLRELVDSVTAWPEDARLVVTNVGDSPWGRELRGRAERSARAADILLLPTISREDLLRVQRLASVGVCLIRRTGALETLMPAPNKVAEYVHAGLVVLGFPTGILSRLAGEQIAVVIEERDPIHLTDGVRRALVLARSGDARARAARAAADWYNMDHQAAPIVRFVVGDTSAASLAAVEGDAGNEPSNESLRRVTSFPMSAR